MKIIKSLLPVALVIMAAGFTSFTNADSACLWTWADCKVSTEVSVEVIAGDICIWTTWSLDLGQITSSATATTVNGTFADEFWVEDLKGADSGYYTTLQLSGDLVDGAGNSISASNVSVQTATVGSAGITLMNGGANTRVEVDAGMASYATLDSARTFIKRDNAANSGIVGQYGAFPQIQINVPAYQAVGTYTATLCYTLIEN